MSQQLEIMLLDKKMIVACPEGQAAALLESADILNKKMSEMRQKLPTTSLLNVALMSALNISNELINVRQQHQDSDHAMAQSLMNLSTTIEKTLSTDK